MSKPLTNKIALVTGGSRGIGAAIARRLADDGAHVAISYSSSADKADALVKELIGKGVKAIAVKADQADAAQVERLVDTVKDKLGGLDILVNNAGVFVTGLLGDPANDMKAFARQQAINVNGTVAAVRSAVKYMKKGGRIVTIGSVIGERSLFPGGSDYAATKAAVAAYSRGWARDLGPKGITVNTIQPGPINTDMNPENSEMSEGAKAMTLLGRYGQPEEIAGAVAFIVGPDASYITGATLNVDGGVNS